MFIPPIVTNMFSSAPVKIKEEIQSDDEEPAPPPAPAVPSRDVKKRPHGSQYSTLFLPRQSNFRNNDAQPKVEPSEKADSTPAEEERLSMGVSVALSAERHEVLQLRSSSIEIVPPRLFMVSRNSFEIRGGSKPDPFEELYISEEEEEDNVKNAENADSKGATKKKKEPEIMFLSDEMKTHPSNASNVVPIKKYSGPFCCYLNAIKLRKLNRNRPAAERHAVPGFKSSAYDLRSVRLKIFRDRSGNIFLANKGPLSVKVQSPDFARQVGGPLDKFIRLMGTQEAGYQREHRMCILDKYTFMQKMWEAKTAADLDVGHISVTTKIALIPEGDINGKKAVWLTIRLLDCLETMDELQRSFLRDRRRPRNTPMGFMFSY